MKVATKLSHDIASLSDECESRQGSHSSLVQEAINLGFIVRKVIPHCEDTSISSFWCDASVVAGFPPRVRLPSGHRFYRDCHREQLARLLEWMLRKHINNSWFFTGTFTGHMTDEYGHIFVRKFLSRLNQAHCELKGATPISSVYSVEWQGRGTVHYHLLIFGNKLGLLSRKRWELRWKIAGGGYGRDYDAEIKSAPYLVKHQVKDKPDNGINIGGAWRGFHPPLSIGRCCVGNAVPMLGRDALRCGDSLRTN